MEPKWRSLICWLCSHLQGLTRWKTPQEGMVGEEMDVRQPWMTEVWSRLLPTPGSLLRYFFPGFLGSDSLIQKWLWNQILLIWYYKNSHRIFFKGYSELIYKTETDFGNKLKVTKGEGMDWGFEIGKCTLLIWNGWPTGTCCVAQGHLLNVLDNLHGSGYVHLCGWLTFLYSRNSHTLYINYTAIKFFSKNSHMGWSGFYNGIDKEKKVF